MPLPPTIALCCALASGVAYWMAFPPCDVGAVAWVALVPLLVGVVGRRPAAAAALGWLAGSVAIHALVTPSIREAAGRFLPTHPVLAWVMAVGLPQLYVAPWFAAFAGCVALVPSAVPLVLRPWAVAAAWAAAELLRSRVGDGAPWVLLGHAAHATPWLLQPADVGGAPAVGFVIALAGAGLAVAADPRQGGARGRLGALALAATGVAAAWGYGAWRLATVPAADGAPVRVAVVQPDVPEAWRTSLRHLGDTLARLRGLTEAAAAARPDLVVWPENALTAVVTERMPALGGIAALLPPSAHLVAGAPRLVEEDDGRRTLRNAMLVVDATGRVVGTYDKQRLTPYGETLPWTLSLVLPRPADAGDEYRPGSGGPPVAAGGMRLAAAICWEGIYADLVRTQVRDGATLLVNVSNDGWFGRQPSLEQHFHATQLRAVETRRWLVRGTNAGISAVVDPRGVVVATAPRDVPIVLPATVALRDGLTPYVRVGDAFGWGCVAVTLLVVRRSRRRASARS